MDIIRGKWYKKYINCWEDKRDYDIHRRGYAISHECVARDYCKKFSPPELTDAEKQEISQYWAQFGIKISDYDWHRMYYHVTKKHDPRFVPDLVVGLILYEYYNDRAYETTWRDKNKFHRLLPNVPLPKAICRRIKGNYYGDELNFIADENSDVQAVAKSIWKHVDKDGDIIFKNTRETGYGKNVKKYHVCNETDLSEALAQWKNCPNYVIQICVKQHKVMASLNESSSNMLRICSWRHDGKVDILYATARVGAGKSFTDVSFVDGEERVNLVGISKDGYFANKMIDQNGCKVKDLPEKLRVPQWDKIIDVIKKNHLLIDDFNVIGWDFTVDQDENPICFEWNIQWPGTVLYQFANEEPLYGDKTEEIFEFLKDEKNRRNFIPYYMQLK